MAYATIILGGIHSWEWITHLPVIPRPPNAASTICSEIEVIGYQIVVKAYQDDVVKAYLDVPSAFRGIPKNPDESYF